MRRHGVAAVLAMMGLTPGWGDLCEWARVEQFVGFRSAGRTAPPLNGYYLLRSTVNARPNGLHLLETRCR